MLNQALASSASAQKTFSFRAQDISSKSGTLQPKPRNPEAGALLGLQNFWSVAESSCAGIRRKESDGHNCSGFCCGSLDSLQNSRVHDEGYLKALLEPFSLLQQALPIGKIAIQQHLFSISTGICEM